MAVSADRTGSRAVFEGKLSGRLRRRKCRDEKETAGEHPEPSKRAMRPAVPARKIRSGQIWGPKRVALFSGPVPRKNGVLREKKWRTLLTSVRRDEWHDRGTDECWGRCSEAKSWSGRYEKKKDDSPPGLRSPSGLGEDEAFGGFKMRKKSRKAFQ